MADIEAGNSMDHLTNNVLTSKQVVEYALAGRSIQRPATGPLNVHRITENQRRELSRKSRGRKNAVRGLTAGARTANSRNRAAIQRYGSKCKSVFSNNSVCIDRPGEDIPEMSPIPIHGCQLTIPE